MISYRDVKASPSGWEGDSMGNANDPVENFEYALANMIDRYRNKYARRKVIEALTAQAGLLVGDDGWDKSEPSDPIEAEPPDAVEIPGEPAPQTDEPTAPTAA